MFAFVIYDLSNKKYFVAKYRSGIKPLYFYKNDNSIAYNSELNALKYMFDCSAIDEWLIRQYKKVRMFFDGHTIYKDIKMFPAGFYDDDGKLKGIGIYHISKIKNLLVIMS